MSSDREIVARQLGREPRGSWKVAVRCASGSPVVIVTRPELEGGEPFPTLYWLTCPALNEMVSALESDGEIERWRARLADDADLAQVMRAADEAYRRLRHAESGGADRCELVGIAGQRDPLQTKCIHAHVAAYLAGIQDPIGESIIGGRDWECHRARCQEGEVG